MYKQISTLFCSSLLIVTATAHPGGQSKTDYLRECMAKMAPANGAVWQLYYRETAHQTYHSPEPWQTMRHISSGAIWCNGSCFAQLDTVNGKKSPLVSKMQWKPGELLIQPYWSDKIGNPSVSELEEQPLELARYTPLPLLLYFSGRSVKAVITGGYAAYHDTVNGAPVTIFIDRNDQLVKRISYVQPHDMWGDVETTVEYGACLPGTACPGKALIRKVHGITDTVAFADAHIEPQMPPLLVKPEGYTTEPDEKNAPAVVTKMLRDHIYTVTFLHTESTGFLVEFKDFFMAIDVPLCSENGELMLAEARKLAPGKPVKYYAFGHHHPWALGGVRPFIRNGATILTVPEDEAYLRFIATAKHSLKPDSLQLQPRPLHTAPVNDSFTVTDGETTVQMIRIGEQSHHTKDFMVFYFPKEKLLFEGDLTAIPKEGAPRKAGDRQEEGLYQAIKDRHMVVDTIVQQWPVSDRYPLKNIFSFAELEQSVQAK